VLHKSRLLGQAAAAAAAAAAAPGRQERPRGDGRARLKVDLVCVGEGSEALARPSHHLGRSAQRKDSRELLEVGEPREEGLPGEGLGEDAARGPDVNRGALAARSEEDLGRALPARGDLVREDKVALHRGRVRVRGGDAARAVGAAPRRAKGSRQSEVANPQPGARRDDEEQIRGLHVAVHDAVGVHVREALEEVAHEHADCAQRKERGGRRRRRLRRGGGAARAALRAEARVLASLGSIRERLAAREERREVELRALQDEDERAAVDGRARAADDRGMPLEEAVRRELAKGRRGEVCDGGNERRTNC
jgi:hypothetical protein